jgi:hypothetical protein
MALEGHVSRDVTSTFVPDAKGIEAILKMPELASSLGQEAKKIADKAREIAPSGVDGGTYGAHYADMIHVWLGLVSGKAVARVNAFKYTSHWIEWGSVHNPALHVLRNAAQACGYELKD